MAKSDNHELSNTNNETEDRKEAGHSSSSAEIKDDEWKISIFEERPIAYLPKVPRELREKEQNKGFFDPRVVSIGPYHHGKPEFEEAEKLKSRAARTFIGDSNREHEFYNKIVQVVSDARNCYIPGSTDAYDDEAFAHMMFFDGCFILQFIDDNIDEEEGEGGPFIHELIKHLGSGAHRTIISDMMLLENQLPFLVLQTLISTRYPEGKGEKLIENFIIQIYIDNMATWTERTYKHEREQPLHFLDLVRRRFLGRYSPTDEEEEVSSSSSSSKEDKDGPRSLCSCMMSSSWCKRGHSRETNPMKDPYSHSFHSATELKAMGIHFRPSTTFVLNDFSFTSRFGYGLLKVPHLAFGRGIKYWLMNMMAYELAPYREFFDLEVCNYIYFMNSLINGADDVKELRIHNIIHNFYGTDDEDLMLLCA